ncbi:AraC family transcriptional regulator [Luteibacter aegosomatissinici]|uniref:AraC family transcriptional regulator n=1 Tax=Luteibacter aegosomatissinici TaxID=2911539 RepID=UPI001FFBD730|nr:AraC family transcriptional regulator [Luteibacter aegosomatissinici]UPG94608.1 AraC family transcriptional regulator [Luteibacter aegosomatissinici]
MADPFTEVVTLLQPVMRFSKVVAAVSPWRVTRTTTGEPFYCAVLEGSSRLLIHGQAPLVLHAGDFVLVPAALDFTTESLVPPPADHVSPVTVAEGRARVGAPEGTVDYRALIGHCAFGSPDAALLVSLLPGVLHVRGEPRLTALVGMVGDESRGDRPARDVVLERLLEVLFIDALRSAGATAPTGLVRGLADTRLALPLRRIHESPAEAWTVARMANEAALSRSAFFDRFTRVVGVAPMEYLLTWRMALARQLLRREGAGVASVAEQVGYGSASAFSVAFARHVGQPPARFARAAE